MAPGQPALPGEENGESDESHDTGAVVDEIEHRAQRAEGRTAVALDEGQVAFRVDIVTDGMRDLLEDDDDADGRQHALDDRGGKEVGQYARTGEAEADLQQAGQHHRDEEGLVTAERLDGGEDDGDEARGRSRNAERRAAQTADHQSTDDTGDDPGDQRRTAGERDAQAQGHGDEEDHDTGGKILAQMLEQGHGVTSPGLAGVGGNGCASSYPSILQHGRCCGVPGAGECA